MTQAPAPDFQMRVVVGAELACVGAEGIPPYLVATEEGGQARVVAAMGPRYEPRASFGGINAGREAAR